LGGLLKPDYIQHDRRAHKISSAAVKVLRYLQTRPWETVHVLKLKRPLQQELEEVMAFYLTYLLERDLKSVEFLKRLREEARLFGG
jgi:DNA repair protein RecO (recombination protein O)